MTAGIYLYRATLRDGSKRVLRGRVEAADPAHARELLREGGLIPLALQPMRGPSRSLALPPVVETWWQGHQRTRRRHQRADLLDALATMLQTGLSLTDALRALESRADAARPSEQDRMLLAMRTGVGAGRPFSACIADQPAWFSPSESARVQASEQRGELAATLAALAESNQRSADLWRRLLGVMTYPCIVATVGIGVIVFLSIRTLPELLGVLTDAGVRLPGLSVAVMRLGQGLVSVLPWLPVLLIAFLAVAVAAASSRGISRTIAGWLDRLAPRFIRRARLAQVCDELADMLDSGIQIVEALRIMAASQAGMARAGLRDYLSRVADAVSDGEELDEALPDPRWADTEFVRLLTAGQASGELPRVLRRIADRYTRDAMRRIERLSSLLEPAVIIMLAAMVGAVVMAAVLPLIRLQEVV